MERQWTGRRGWPRPAALGSGFWIRRRDRKLSAPFDILLERQAGAPVVVNTALSDPADDFSAALDFVRPVWLGDEIVDQCRAVSPISTFRVIRPVIEIRPVLYEQIKDRKQMLFCRVILFEVGRIAALPIPA